MNIGHGFYFSFGSGQGDDPHYDTSVDISWTGGKPPDNIEIDDIARKVADAVEKAFKEALDVMKRTLNEESDGATSTGR